jgi:hypothetical protein
MALTISNSILPVSAIIFEEIKNLNHESIIHYGNAEPTLFATTPMEDAMFLSEEPNQTAANRGGTAHYE